MHKLIHKILDNYKEEIKAVEESNLNDFNNVEQGISISRQYLQQLRVCVRENEFQDKQNEIIFFKKHKPYVYSRLKFYAKLYNFLINRPAGTIKSQQEFIDSEINKLQESNRRNIDFIKYYREDSELLDEFYFLRGNDKISLVSNTSHFYTDAEFSTSHDNAIAKIMAYDLLISHYVEELSYLRDLSNGVQNKLSTLSNGERLGWTASKTDLIELIYALQASGAIKSGTAGIKEMASACEDIFELKLGNVYRTFLEIRERKIDQTKFIDRLKATLLRRMEETDG
ncbi:RteC domain-containing protein [Aequorivita marina]|uniref:RteC domain-containing protein n=1 Tax=Aequorivita marina TaxID=3073654 RepID=UPI00287431D5|nr:RteC domain-containing protein [Aequorivita sp. S2608]MDS1297055.1 RteC domain-containing protein [Aequorivita sp. S2608]